jgi:hypothetical protein
MMNSDTKFIKANLKFIDPSSGSVGGVNSKFSSIMEMELMDGHIESISVRASESGKAIEMVEEVVLSFHHVIVNYHAYDRAKKTRIRMPAFEATQPEYA